MHSLIFHVYQVIGTALFIGCLIRVLQNQRGRR